MTARRRANARRSASTRTRTRTRPRWDAFCACAHTYAHTRMHCCVHTYARTHVPGRARLVRARSRPARPRVGASAGTCERGGAGTHSFLRFGQSAAAGSAASSVLDASLRAHRPAAPGGPGPPLTRAGRPRAPAMRARGSADGRRPATPPPPHPTARGSAPAPGAASATRRSAAPAPPRTRTGGGAAGARRTVPPRACTGRATRGAPAPSWRRSTCRAPRARAAARCNNGRTWGRTGRSHGNSPRMP
jgi:hypothetical protein